MLILKPPIFLDNRKNRGKIQAMEMKYLKAIQGKMMRDKIRNTSIRKELRIEEIKNEIVKSRLKWY